MDCTGRPNPLGYQQLTGLTVAQTLAIPAGANYAVIRATTQMIRYRDDGVAATANVGMPLYPGEVLLYDSPVGLPKLSFFDSSSSTGSIDALFYGVARP